MSSETTNSFDLSLDGDKSLTAVFTNVTTYHLTTPANPPAGGVIVRSAAPDFDGYIAGTEVVVTARPNQMLSIG